jgi:hypothetical protein
LGGPQLGRGLPVRRGRAGAHRVGQGRRESSVLREVAVTVALEAREGDQHLANAGVRL